MQMCPVKWQMQYDLMENSTLVSTRALLLVPENIKSNVELDDKPPIAKTRQKGLTPKERWNLVIHVTPKRPRKAGQRSTVLSARNMGTRTQPTTPRSTGTIIKTEATRRQAGHPNPTSQQVERMG